jgi:hypothetical protein
VLKHPRNALSSAESYAYGVDPCLSGLSESQKPDSSLADCLTIAETILLGAFDGTYMEAFILRPKIPLSQPEGHVDQTDQRWHLYEWAHDTDERLSGVQSLIANFPTSVGPLVISPAKIYRKKHGTSHRNTNLRYRMAIVRGGGLPGSSLAALRFVRWTVLCCFVFTPISCQPPATCRSGYL